MQNPKEELSKFYKGLRSRYASLSEAIELHKFLSDEVSDGQIKTINNFIDFYSVIHISLNTYIIIQLANFFYHREADNKTIETKRSLKHFLNLVKSNINPLTKEYKDKKRKDLLSEINNQISKIASKETIIDRLLTNRNQFYGHFDPKYFANENRLREDAPLFWQELEELKTICKEILDWHSNNFGFSAIEDSYNHKTKDDAKRILHNLTFYKVASQILPKEVNSEFYNYLLDETDREINRNETNLTEEDEEQIKKQILETSSLVSDLIRYKK